jgi:subtilase family serine protease
VISISYSISEHFLTFYEVVIFDIEATKLLLQGVTILAAAGDAGVTGDGLGQAFCGYNPVFPASSIYVTAVGGTQGAPTLLLGSRSTVHGPRSKISVISHIPQTLFYTRHLCLWKGDNL